MLAARFGKYNSVTVAAQCKFSQSLFQDIERQLPYTQNALERVKEINKLIFFPSKIVSLFSIK